MHRRTLLLTLAAGAVTARPATASAPPAVTFPTDFGSHPAARTEWWYVTGSLGNQDRLWGFQVTFFRSSTGFAARDPAHGGSRFAPDQLIFAHAALTDLAHRRLRHDQRIARSGFGIAQAAVGQTDVALRDWHLQGLAPSGSSPSLGRYSTQVSSDSAGFAFDLQLAATQAPLLQGVGGLSSKGPGAGETSHYYSEPQLAVLGRLRIDGEAVEVRGRAWLDHEWSDAFLPPQAVGWDWIGMNLDDGSALTAFRLRRADGSTVYAGGSFRRAGAIEPNAFGPTEVRFIAGRIWQSPGSRARYPVAWQVQTPVGEFQVAALLDDQELDSRGSTGSIYWEGLSDLLDREGRRVGRGYLEMTGYATALRL